MTGSKTALHSRAPVHMKKVVNIYWDPDTEEIVVVTE